MRICLVYLSTHVLKSWIIEMLKKPMLTYHQRSFSIFFGDKQNAFQKQQFYSCTSSHELLAQSPFAFLQTHDVETFIVADQTHGVDGLIITSAQQAANYLPYSRQADFIITNVPGVALGVATADCLPIVFYDPANHVIALAHAGWQGTVKGIALSTVQAMTKNFGTNSSELQIFFGPSASVEAYEVSPDFIHNISTCDFINDVFIQKNGRYYFNVVLYNQRLLETFGVKQFNHDYHKCTITNLEFCSHRREKELSLRQMTIALLYKN